MINYTYTFSTSGDVQTALDNGSLGKPYVAYITSTSGVDWNTKDVTPDYIASWEDVYGDHTLFKLTILNTSQLVWETQKKIGTIHCWYAPIDESEVIEGDVDIYLEFGISGGLIHFVSRDEKYSETMQVENFFYSEHISVVSAGDITDSDWESLFIEFNTDGEYTYTFRGGEGSPVQLTTINPTE